jgi:hypothetical protein
VADWAVEGDGPTGPVGCCTTVGAVGVVVEGYVFVVEGYVFVAAGGYVVEVRDG